MERAIYSDNGVSQVEAFFDSLYSEAKGEAESGFLDSATDVAKSFLKNQSGQANMPKAVEDVLARMPASDQHRVLDSVLYGMSVYEREHGCLPTADVMAAALQQGLSASHSLDKSGRVLDSVSNTGHHDPISTQPNRIVVAITSAIAEAIPFGCYLPTDINSNEARLGIVSHMAGSTFGDYVLNEIMDGVNVGKQYLGAERRVSLTLAGDRLSATGGVFTTTGGATTVQVLRGRTIVFVNGFPCAAENPNVGGAVAASPISGVATISGVDYTIGGTVTIATGALALTFSPALPANTAVEAEAFIDYEASPLLSPELIAQVQTFQLFASPWRARARQSIDSRTQVTNELGLDLSNETLIAIRNQFAMERHYSGLAKMKALGANNAQTYNFDVTNQIQQKTRAQIWQDFQAVLGIVDQKMAEDTMDHGITHLYVDKAVAAQLLSLPRELFVPSGLSARPGIFRLGTLFGRFEVYYTPKCITNSSTTSQIICVGRSTQVARCPLVLGDAVAPTYLPLAFGDDMKYGNAFYARNFTSVNPHVPSAKGAAIINITNLFSA